MFNRIAAHVSLRFFLMLSLVLALAGSGTAQTFRGGITGSVTDQSGAVVSNAAVAATDVATGAKRETTSSSAGEFLFQDLPLGNYTVTVTAEYSDRATQISNPFGGVDHSIQNGAVQWINPVAFEAAPVNGTYGTSRRNQYFNPGFSDVDLSVFKNTKIGERVTAQFRVEMFNLFNRVNLAPVGNYLGGGFGQSTTTIGAYNVAPGIGAGEPYNTQLALNTLLLVAFAASAKLARQEQQSPAVPLC